ncbi:MARVEL domain-containing protein 3 isoform X2 [Betta splendens]|uniref:MARVEL domain-containing protein 3 isoform X2 n=1 Tax=Betta splendens TaxID=158456 RepID=A0A6P7M1I1_BETSP|nr:MARVEL domain-containing protein 3 isoform X2 [Betta splendens]
MFKRTYCEKMPQRDRRPHGSDMYAEYKSRVWDNPQNSDNLHNGRGHNHRSRDQRRSAGGSESKTNRHRDVTSDSHNEPHVYRNYHQEEAPGMSRETSVYQSDREYYEQPHRQAVYNLRYVLTSRGLCQVMELFVNLLLVICAGIPYSNNVPYRDVASLGGLYYYYYGGASAFTGAEAEKVKTLDQQFFQLRQPPYVCTMACGGVLMVYVCAMLALGIFRVTYRWPPVLLGEALLNLLIGLGYIPALAFYFIKVQEAYNNPICSERDQMYKSKGLNGYGCQFNGADIAGGLFGVLGVFVFIFGAVLAVRAFRSVRELKEQRRTNEDNNL